MQDLRFTKVLSRFSCWIIALILTAFGLLTTSCQSKEARLQAKSQLKGEEIIRQLITELQDIHSREELVTASSKLKALFNDLVDVIIQAREQAAERAGNKTLAINPEQSQKQMTILSQQLQVELARIYILEGGRALTETAQAKALNRLDLLEKRSKGQTYSR